MKTKLLLFSMLVFGMMTMNGQTQPNLSELLSRLEVNHSGSVNDVFTPQELTVLRTHFDAINEPSPVFNPEGGGKNIFGPENNSTNSFGFFNTSDVGTFNIIGPGGTADFEGAGCQNPFTGDFFVIDNAGNAYEVNPVSGVYTPLGTVTPPAGENIVGVEFDPDTLEFYAMSTDGAGSSTISTINVVTLTVTPIGNTGLMLPIALAINGSGQAFTYDIDDDILYSLNKTTGVATSIGPIGFDANFGQGMFYNPLSDNVYMTAFNGTTFQSEFRMVDTTTGNTTSMGVIGGTSPGGTLQYAWSSTDEDLLAVGELAFEGFTLYPNPANNVVNLSAKSGLENIAIYTMLGQKVLELSLDGTTASIDVSSLNAGTYIAKVTINGVEGSQVFVRK